MEDKKFLKYLLISWILCGALCVSGGPVLSATKSSLTQKLNQTNSKRNYFLQKKKQADLRLRSERNKLSNNQQKLEKAQSELRTTTQRYNALVSNLTTMERQLSAAVEEFKSIDAAMKARIRQVYKHQRTGMFELILSATDLNNLMDMFYFEKIVIQDDYRRMQQVKEKANEIAMLKTQVENQKRMVEASIRDINNQRATIQGSIAENKSMIVRLQKDKSYYERSEKELARQSASIQNMIEQLTRKNASSGSSQVKVS